MALAQTTAAETDTGSGGDVTVESTTSDAISATPAIVMLTSFLFVSIARNLL